MRKIVLAAVFAAFLPIFFFALRPESGFHSGMMKFLTQDAIYLNDSYMVEGWIWNEKNGIVIGEAKDKTIFVFKDSEILKIEKDKMLNYLHGMA